MIHDHENLSRFFLRVCLCKGLSGERYLHSHTVCDKLFFAVRSLLSKGFFFYKYCSIALAILTGIANGLVKELSSGKRTCKVHGDAWKVKPKTPEWPKICEVDRNLKDGGDQIEYEDKGPMIR